MRWLRWFQEHIVWALVGATIWVLGVCLGYGLWVALGGWSIENNLALAQALAPVASAGLAAMVVIAAVLAFLPPRARLSCAVETDQRSRVPQFIIANAGAVPATDVAIEITVVPLVEGQELDEQCWLSDLAPDERYWAEDPLQYERVWTDVDGKMHVDRSIRRILKRSSILPGGAREAVFAVPPDNITNIGIVRVTASNADEVRCYPHRRDKDGAPRPVIRRPAPAARA